MRGKRRASHRRSTPMAWLGARVAAAAVLLVAGSFGVGLLVTGTGDDPAGAGAPAVIRPTADRPHAERESRGNRPTASMTPAAQSRTADPSTPSADPTRTERRLSRAARREGERRDRPEAEPTVTSSATPAGEPTGEATAEPTDEPSQEPTEEPSDEPTDDDGLLPPLPGNRSEQAWEARSKHRPDKSDTQ